MKPLIRKIKSSKKTLIIDLPKTFINKNLKIMINVDDEAIEKTIKADKIKIDTRKWKFSREEIYE